jgi:hypothetical protein
MGAHVAELPALLERQGGLNSGLEPAIGVAAGMTDGATEIALPGCLPPRPGIMEYRSSADPIFDGVVARVW